MLRERLSASSAAVHPSLMSSLKNLVGTVVDIVHTRIQILTTEIQEEKERLVQILLLAIVSVFCLSIAALLLTLLIVVAFWDSYRIQAIVALILIYGGAGIFTALSFRNKVRAQPALLAATLSELTKDKAQLQKNDE